MKNTLLYAVVLVLFFTVSCKPNNSKKDLLIGKWHGELFLDSKQMQKLNSAQNDSNEMRDTEMNGKSDVEYFSTGKYNEEATLNLRLSEANQTMTLKFDLRDAGTWTIDDNDQLIVTSEDAVLTPADDISKAFLTEVPEFIDMIRPLKGETEKSTLVRIDAEFHKLKTQDNLTIDYTRINN
jgi:hypothetical protein